MYVNNAEYSGVTPLMHASVNRRIKVIKLLFELGAKVDIQDSKGGTALDYAFAHPVGIETANLLIKHGAKVTDETWYRAVILMDQRYSSTNVDNADFLLKHGANINARRGEALKYAVLSGNADNVYYFLEHGANPNIKDDKGYSAIDYAFIMANDDKSFNRRRGEEIIQIFINFMGVESLRD